MTQTPVLMTEDEYVAFELSVNERHEYVDGVVRAMHVNEHFEDAGGTIRAMSGPTRRHNEVAINLCFGLRMAKSVSLSPCRISQEGVRLRVSAKRHYYPDLMVSCEEPDDNAYTESAPCFVAEILSPSTASIDRGEKRIAYFQIPSMRQYVIIDHENEIIESHHRAEPTDPWTISVLRPGDVLDVVCPKTTISVDEILRAQ
jgi:Uma2 family endonuclease